VETIIRYLMFSGCRRFPFRAGSQLPAYLSGCKLSERISPSLQSSRWPRPTSARRSGIREIHGSERGFDFIAPCAALHRLARKGWCVSIGP
jgi:hypothetical protein